LVFAMIDDVADDAAALAAAAVAAGVAHCAGGRERRSVGPARRDAPAMMEPGCSFFGGA
jgi:hypothetical protein